MSAEAFAFVQNLLREHINSRAKTAAFLSAERAADAAARKVADNVALKVAQQVSEALKAHTASASGSGRGRTRAQPLDADAPLPPKIARSPVRRDEDVNKLQVRFDYLPT